MYFFLSDKFPSKMLFFYSSLMIIFKIFPCSICNLYFIVGDISELHLLFISSPRTTYFRYNYFRSKNFVFSIFYPSVFQPYWKIWEFLKSQILKNQCSNCLRNWKLYFSPFASHLFLRDLQSIDFSLGIVLYFVIDRSGFGAPAFHVLLLRVLPFLVSLHDERIRNRGIERVVTNSYW